MRRTFTVSCVAALALAVAAPGAIAAPTTAHNYQAIPASCQGLGEIVIEVTNLGQWGTGKVQGTQLTLVPRTFTFLGTHVESDTVVFDDVLEKPNAEVDDVCAFSIEEVIPPGDPFLPEGGTLHIEGTVGVKIVGP